ncbi:MAG TPA: SDR family NAD(P)-dependent oxidoreductase [Pirellulaceae bacterium]|nr:SDR family NAD(P)-dependent oxidoreductase [Pirellulaceae bacterium]
MDLHDKVSLVTGGTLGIGAAIVMELAKRGSHLAVAARNVSEGPANELKAAVEKLGRQCVLIPADLAKSEDCRFAIEQTVQQLGRLDVLVHNAGGPSFGKIEDVSEEQWLHTMALHVNANFFLAKAALPHLRTAGSGAIIMISSTAGIRGVPGAVAYATAKGALPQFTRTLAKDLADDNIRVNCVLPGIITTRFHDSLSAERRKYNCEHRIPLHREGRPEEVADAVTFLIQNDYITGESLVIDGGLTSRITG